MSFKIVAEDSKSNARAGTLVTDHGEIHTPIFMPVGTQGSVKAVTQNELVDIIQAEIILGNTYHLYLRPKIDVLEKAGGLHQFMDWDKPLLTDSGGYQVYSLGEMRKITEEGVNFSSHIDGSKHLFTPEKAIDIQKSIGADIIMAFDECTPYPCEFEYAKNSLQMTHRWLDRCIEHHQRTPSKYGYNQELAPIVQGSIYEDLRKESAEFIASREMNINAIGGLSVGEPHELLYQMTDIVCNILPKAKPRYLMGVGTPVNLLECISLGIDMFDCVLPTRNARHGMIYTSEGIINIKNAKWANDFNVLDEASSSPYSKKYSKAYVRHLFHVKEYLGAQITSVHNLSFFLWLVKESRKKIQEGTFRDWKDVMVKKLAQRL
jgi:queuine tRNA-ribosyltransferase